MSIPSFIRLPVFKIFQINLHPWVTLESDLHSFADIGRSVFREHHSGIAQSARNQSPPSYLRSTQQGIGEFALVQRLVCADKVNFSAFLSFIRSYSSIQSANALRNWGFWSSGTTEFPIRWLWLCLFWIRYCPPRIYQCEKCCSIFSLEKIILYNSRCWSMENRKGNKNTLLAITRMQHTSCQFWRTFKLAWSCWSCSWTLWNKCQLIFHQQHAHYRKDHWNARKGIGFVFE